MLPLSPQRGAMFGLDARISLVIFTLLTLVAGYMGLKAFSQIKTQSFVNELHQVSQAFAQLEADLQRRCIDSTPACGTFECNNLNSYAALYDAGSLNATYLPRWHGPYLSVNAPAATKYGAGAIFYYTNDAATACTAGNPCYAWLRWGAVPLSVTVMENANALLDNAAEINPDTSGQFQWTDNGDSTYMVVYRLGRSISN